MSGSSSPSGETRYNWNEDMAPRWNSILNTAPWATDAFMFGSDGNVAGVQPREQFTGNRFAGNTYDQNAAGTNIRALNDYSSDPTKSMNAARGGIEDTLGGRFLDGPGFNPYASYGDNPFIYGIQNQYGGQAANQFAGDNPYFRNVVQKGVDDIVGGYERGAAADTTRAAVMSGAFGGDAHQKTVQNNQATLGKTLSGFADQMYNQQYDRSAQLDESRLGRGFQAGEGMLNRGSQGWNQNMDRATGAFENERNRMMGAIGAGQNEQGLALGRAGAQMDWGNQQQKQNQNFLDFHFDQWNQNQQHPFQVLDWLSGLYGRAQGGMAPNSQVYQSGASSAAPWLGAGLAGLSFLGG